MCRLLGLTFVAVVSLTFRLQLLNFYTYQVSKDLEEAKIKQITQFGGEIMKVDNEICILQRSIEPPSFICLFVRNSKHFVR